MFLLSIVNFKCSRTEKVFLTVDGTMRELIIISRGHKANFGWQLPFIDSIDDLEYNKRLFDNCRPTRYFVKF